MGILRSAWQRFLIPVQRRFPTAYKSRNFRLGVSSSRIFTITCSLKRRVTRLPIFSHACHLKVTISSHDSLCTLTLMPGFSASVSTTGVTKMAPKSCEPLFQPWKRIPRPHSWLTKVLSRTEGISHSTKKEHFGKSTWRCSSRQTRSREPKGTGERCSEARIRDFRYG